MATSTELTKRMASALGVPEPTVALQMRLIREAGMMTQGGRGRSAAHMTAGDAAALLIAVVGAISPKDSVEAVRSYGSIKVTTSELPPGSFPEFDALGEVHSFAEGIAAIIQASVSRDITEGDVRYIWVELFWPWSACKVSFIVDEELQWIVQYGGTIEVKPGGTGIRFTSPYRVAGDLKQTRRFTQETIISIAKLLRN